jgi:hypothetical protein
MHNNWILGTYKRFLLPQEVAPFESLPSIVVKIFVFQDIPPYCSKILLILWYLVEKALIYGFTKEILIPACNPLRMLLLQGVWVP